MRPYATPRQPRLNRQIGMVSPSVLATEPAGGDTDARELLDWVRSGGTAVVFGGTVNQWKRLEINAGTVAGTQHTMISGGFSPVGRRPFASRPLYFETPGRGWIVRLPA